MIDIITVVFEPEIPVLRAQAQSIALYGQKLGIRNIYVVLNDSEIIANQIDPSWWGPLANSVLVIPRTAFSTSFVENGWVSQQVLKLLAASISYNTYSMIMDAKSLLVKEINPAEFISDTGQIHTGLLDIYPVFEPSRKITSELFDIDLKKQLGPGGVPFIMHNDTVRMMIAETTMRTKTSFPFWFQQQGMLTEFILYSGFVQFLCGELTVLYSNENKLGAQINVSHDEVDQWNKKFFYMSRPNTFAVSVHRTAWKNMLPEQQQQYRDLLLQRGIEAAAVL
jgi:hypothetical protein